MDREPPIYCNKYAIKKLDLNPKRSKSMPRHLQPRVDDDIFLEDVLPVRAMTTDDEFDDVREKRMGRRKERPSKNSNYFL